MDGEAGLASASCRTTPRHARLGRRLAARRRAIWRRFYTPGHVLRLAWKILRGRMVTPALLARLAVAGVKGGLARRRRNRQRRKTRRGERDSGFAGRQGGVATG